MHYFLIALGLLVVSVPTLAMFCPKNFNQINVGDTFEQVAAQCGKPDSQKNSKQEDMSIPQEWTYFVAMPTDPLQSYGSVKVTVAFAGGRVVNISSGGYSVGSTSLCNSTPIQVGSTMKQVIAACGKATMVNKAAPSSPAESKGTEIVDWYYNSTPPITLRFINGKFSSRDS